MSRRWFRFARFMSWTVAIQLILQPVLLVVPTPVWAKSDLDQPALSPNEAEEADPTPLGSPWPPNGPITTLGTPRTVATIAPAGWDAYGFGEDFTNPEGVWHDGYIGLEVGDYNAIPPSSCLGDLT